MEAEEPSIQRVSRRIWPASTPPLAISTHKHALREDANHPLPKR
jgi:hypothetical protein